MAAEEDCDSSVFRIRCRSVAYGAEKIHDWLEPILRSSAAARNAYAFKQRKKKADDIRNKVSAHRNHEDPAKRRANYGPDDVTDASGFRIVKLFNAEVPEALNDLLDLLTASPLPPGDLNGRLKGVGIKEIEFHTSRRLDDPLSIYAEVQKVVDGHGFQLKTAHTRGYGSASSYSSVHVLVECEVREGTSDDVISACSEVQLRSVFEEAWGEISHRLKYAPAKIARATGIAAPLKEDTFTNMFLHLDALKSLTDGCAQYADLINKQLQSLATGRAERKPQPLDPAEKSAAMFGTCGEPLRQAAERAYRLTARGESQ